MVAAAEAMRLDPLTRNFLGVLARNRRLSQLGFALHHRAPDDGRVIGVVSKENLLRLLARALVPRRQTPLAGQR